MMRAGEVVEVRSCEEILATLDRDGSLDGLPFMPEMLALCGQRFTVAKRADKTCDTIEHRGLRRMKATVHLEGARCSGAAHGGCQAACQLFWKEAWLRRVSANPSPADNGAGGGEGAPSAGAGCTSEAVWAATRRASENGTAEERYRCQATELLKASTPLSPWDPRQYLRDLRSGNVGLGDLLKSLAWSLFRWSTEHVRGYRLQVRLFNAVQRRRGGTPFIPLAGERTATPSQTLGLAPGELVQVRRVEEIRDTLDPGQRNRGLYFDKEMTPFCGETRQVHSRVSRIIDEASGRMITLPGSCVILEGASCTGRFHRYCPRAIYPFWREIWLRRTVDGQSSSPAP